MIQIDTANEKAIESHVVDNGVVDKDCERGDTLSPPPSPETTVTSTSTASSMNHNKFPSQDEHEHEDTGDHSECNDCSSSVSSQDSNLHSFAAASTTASATVRGHPSTPKKRSVFSQYWQKTGQTPVSLRPSPLSPPQEQLEGSNNASPVRLQSPEESLLRNLSNADLLEDDDCDWSSIQEEPASCAAPQEHEQQQREDESNSNPSHPPLRRRRSILPPAPMAHPALKSTPTRWKKSASFSAVEGHPSLEYKTRSLPRMKSASSILQPGPSCLRPYQKYSPCKPDDRKTTASSIFPEGGSTESSPPTPGRLSRSPSSCSSIVSSVSFSEAVDVRHFEPPRETFSGKGWSDYFN